MKIKPNCTVDEENIHIEIEKNEKIQGKETIPKKSISVVNNRCGICLGVLTDTIYMNCKHNFCSSCLVEYISSKMNIYEVCNIICPHYACLKVFSYKDIIKILTEYETSSKELCKKYLKKLKEKFLFFKENCLFCPFESCDSYFCVESVTDIDSTIVKCKDNHEFCWICMKTKENHTSTGECIYNNIKNKENCNQCIVCGCLQLKDDVEHTYFKCSSCGLTKCLLCQRYSTSINVHYLAFTPCFYLNKSDMTSIFAHSYSLRIFRLIIIAVIFVLMVPIYVVFGSFGFYFWFNFLKFKISLKNNFNDYFHDFIKFFITLFLSVALYAFTTIMLIAVGIAVFTIHVIKFIFDLYRFYNVIHIRLDKKRDMFELYFDPDRRNNNKDMETILKIDKLLDKFFNDKPVEKL